MIPVEIHPAARAELDASIAFDESRLDGLGLRFLAAVEETTGRIASSPERGSPMDSGFRGGWFRGSRSASSTESRMTRSWSLRLHISIGDRITGTDVPRVANNGMQPTAMRAAADAERWAV